MVDLVLDTVNQIFLGSKRESLSMDFLFTIFSFQVELGEEFRVFLLLPLYKFLPPSVFQS